MWQFLAYVSAPLALFFAMMAIYSFIRGRARKRHMMVQDRLAIGKVQEGDDQALLVRERERNLAVMLDEALQDTAFYARLLAVLEQAGDETLPGAFLLRSVVIGLAPALFFGLLGGSPGMAVIGALIGLVPLLLVLHKRRTRMQKIDSQLPVALEIMTISLRAGHSLAQTIELSAQELQSPLKDELQRCAEEHALGRGLEEVLVNMSQRLPGCRALRTFVVAVLVLQQTGGNLIEIIEQIIETLRMQSQYERKLAAMTAEGKSSARMLSGLPVAFAFLAYLADPGYIGLLFTDPLGQKLLVAALLLWTIGVLWTRKLISPSAG